MSQMRDLNRRTLAILNKAEKAGDQDVALKAIGEVRRNHELLGKLMGELGRAKIPPPKQSHLHLHSNDAVRAFVQATKRLPSGEEMARLAGQGKQMEDAGNDPQIPAAGNPKADV